MIGVCRQLAMVNHRSRKVVNNNWQAISIWPMVNVCELVAESEPTVKPNNDGNRGSCVVSSKPFEQGLIADD